MSVLLYVGIRNILCMYHIKYYVMFSYMHCVCDMLFHICGVMLCCIYNVRLHTCMLYYVTSVRYAILTLPEHHN